MSLLGPISGDSLKTIILERRRYGASLEVGQYVWDQMRFQEETRIDIAERLIHSVCTEVLAERLPPERVEQAETFGFDFPVSPFQHWKQKRAGAWWLRRFVQWRPVKTERFEMEARLVVNLERFRTFPKADITYPDRLGPYVKVAHLDTTWSLR